jgi:colicin import membrane protein
VNREEYVKSLEGLPEEKQKMLLDVFDENEKLRNIKNEAFQERDKHKQKEKELQERLEQIERDKQEAEKKKLEEQNEFKALYEQEKSNSTEKDKLIDELNGKLSPLEQKAKEAEEKAAKVEADRRKELLEQLEDEDLKKVGEKFSDNQSLKVYVETALTKLTNKKPPTDGGRTGKFRKETISGKKWRDLSYEDKEALKKNDPELYEKIKSERNTK